MWGITEKVDNIISNPPYGSKHDGRLIHERVEHCLTLVRRKLALILPLTFGSPEIHDRPRGRHLTPAGVALVPPCATLVAFREKK
jgi:hypothetical protein